MAATCIQAEDYSNEIEDKKLEKRILRRTTTLIVDHPPPARVFQQPKVIYRKIAQKSFVPPRTTYGPRRTKYGPSRTLRKPGKKYRSKGSKHAPFPYKKRAAKPKYGPHKKPLVASSYGPPKKTHNRLYNGIGFGEPPSGHSFNMYNPPKPTEFSRPHKQEFHKEFTSHHKDIDFSSPAAFSESFSKKPFNEDFSVPHQFNAFPNSHGYGEPPVDSFGNNNQNEASLGFFGNPIKSGDPPVDSYGAPIQPNLHDLTFSTAQTFTSPNLDEDYNFGPQSRPWRDESDSNYASTKKRPTYIKLEESDEKEIFVTPTPEKQNEELSLNSYSDIYNFRQAQENKKKKKKSNYYQNIKMLNHPWKGAKMKEESSDEVIVGGQYAEPPGRFVTKLQPDAPMLMDDDSIFAPTITFPRQNDLAVPISSYVNYKSSNMAFSPQNLNDVFSIVEN